MGTRQRASLPSAPDLALGKEDIYNQLMLAPVTHTLARSFKCRARARAPGPVAPAAAGILHLGRLS
jgi:hypothetical protein